MPASTAQRTLTVALIGNPNTGKSTLFGALSLEETVQRLRDEYAAALERLVAAIEEAADAGRRIEPGALAGRLSNEFAIESKPGEGTRVEIARWHL